MLPVEHIGNCRVVSEIASGGMAVVYKAVQESLNRTVAVKALKTSVATDQQFAIRFEREALSLAQLQHENIIHVYDFHRDRGALCIVMEYVEGIDLYDLLEKNNRLPVDVAAIVAMQVARALDYAHYAGVIHRDIKPANIMISRSGGVKLMDFGIARDQSFTTDLTQTGTGLGTPSYMSPEQVLGDKLDFRSDQFSLGIVLYQMATGRKPFVEDAERSAMHKIRLDKPIAPRKVCPEIPRELERLILRCLEKSPHDRWRSTQDLVLALERFLAERVNINYHARLVQFLRVAGVVTDAEAEAYLRPARLPSTPPAHTGRLTWKRAAVVLAGAAAMVTLGLGLKPSTHALEPTMAIAEAAPASATPVMPAAAIPVAAPASAPAVVERRPAVADPMLAVHVVRKGDTLESLATKYYGGAERAAILVEANGWVQARKLHAGERLVVPLAWKYRIESGDTLSSLAQRLLGDQRRAAYLADLNGIHLGSKLAIGQELSMPAQVTHVVHGHEDFSVLAGTYLGDAGKAEALRKYNFRAASRHLDDGDVVIVPITARRPDEAG